MQDKQKVTLYLPPDLHRQLKIRAAVDAEPMSAIAERALDFYLTHPAVIEEVEANHGAYGSTHQVYACPECTTSVVIQEGDLVSLNERPTVLNEEDLKVQSVTTETLVPASV